MATWTQQSTPWDFNFSDAFSGCWSADLGLFVVTGADGNNEHCVLSSSNGTSWTEETTPADFDSCTGHDVCWSPDLGLFCCAVENGGRDWIMTSPDGSLWTFQTNPYAGLATARPRCVDWSPSQGIFAMGWQTWTTGSPGLITTSPDGAVWTSQTTPFDGTSSQCQVQGIRWIEDLGLWVAVGWNHGFGGAARFVMTAPTDASVWTAHTGPVNVMTGVGWSSALSKVFIAGATNPVFSSPNGTAWTDVSPSASDLDTGSDVIEVGTDLLVCGGASSVGAVVATSDGTTWTPQVNPFDHNIEGFGGHSPSLSLTVACGFRFGGGDSSAIIATSASAPPPPSGATTGIRIAFGQPAFG